MAILFRNSYENGLLSITLQSLVFAVVGAVMLVLIYLRLKIFITPKNLPKEYHEHKGKLYAVKYKVLYSGILTFGGSYFTGESAKPKGVVLLVFAAVLLLAIIALGVM